MYSSEGKASCLIISVAQSCVRNTKFRSKSFPFIRNRLIIHLAFEALYLWGFSRVFLELDRRCVALPAVESCYNIGR